MTTNYHTPLVGTDDANAITFNTVFSALDTAITDLAGAGSATQLTVTLGEGVAANQAGYIDLSDGQGYLLDADSITPKAGTIRGFWTATVSGGGSGTLQISGIMSGFSGLTARQPVYVSTTAGNLTQTRSAPSSGGSQVALMQMGIAISATEVYVNPLPIQYQKRNAMADTDTLTVVHHPDANGYRRNIWAYISEVTAGAEATGYASANQDSDVNLRTGGAGGTVTPASSGASGFGIGTPNDWQAAQTFIPDTGELTQITFELLSNTGSPTGTLTWEIRESDGTTTPSTLITSGTHSPTASATNTITVSDGTVLDNSQDYWFILFATSVQSSGNYWRLNTDDSNPYADGNCLQSLNGGSSWTTYASNDAVCSITTSSNLKDKLAQTFAVGSSTDVASVGLWLKKVGSPVGTCTVRIETLTGSEPSGTLADPSATITFAESVLGTSYAEKLLMFASEFTLASGSYALVLSTDRVASASNYIAWGADGSSPSYASGEMFGEESSSWSAESKDAVFSIYEPGVINPARVSVDWWSSTHADMVNRYGDGAGADLDDQTTFKCVRASGFDDVTVVVEIP